MREDSTVATRPRRKRDVDLIRISLWKLKKNLGPYMESIQKAERSSHDSAAVSKPSTDGSDEQVTSSETSSTSDASSLASGSDRKRKRLDGDQLVAGRDVKASTGGKPQGGGTPSSPKSKAEMEAKMDAPKMKRVALAAIRPPAADMLKSIPSNIDLSKAKKPKRMTSGDDDDEDDAEISWTASTKKPKREKREETAPTSADTDHARHDDLHAADVPKRPDSEKTAKAEAPNSATSLPSRQRTDQTKSLRTDGSALNPPATTSVRTNSPRTSQPSSVDHSRHYFSRRRAEMLDDPLGYDDCVEYRLRKHKRQPKPALMSGAINVGFVFNEKGDLQPQGHSSRKSKHARPKTPGDKVTGARPTSHHLMITPAGNSGPRKENTRPRAEGRSEAKAYPGDGRSKRASTQPKSTDLKSKFKASQRSSGRGRKLLS